MLTSDNVKTFWSSFFYVFKPTFLHVAPLKKEKLLGTHGKWRFIDTTQIHLRKARYRRPNCKVQPKESIVYVSFTGTTFYNWAHLQKFSVFSVFSLIHTGAFIGKDYSLKKCHYQQRSLPKLHL